MDANDPPVMTIAEVAAYLRIPRGSVYKLAQRGGIPCQKVGRHWRFRREAIERWLDSDHGFLRDQAHHT
jgi:excisionase family DNA binding protein